MRKLFAALVAVVLSASAFLYFPSGNAATIPLFSGASSGCTEASQMFACLNQLIQQVNSLITPNTMATFSSPRNLVDNGATAVQQRGTGTRTCALNGAAITTAAYAADRWGCDVNVASGAGQMAVITASPAPPLGFPASQSLVRNSGALTQPVCAWQEIPTYKAQTLQGQSVVLSAQIQALAGLAADQGAATQVVNLVIVTGTGTDQGLGTWTASPAITPAFTGLATLINTPVTLPVTPSWQKFSTTATVPTTVNEIAVGLCFTPTATGAGATDGFAFTGVQLEPGAVPSTYEFRAPAQELLEAQRYYWQIADNVASTRVLALCQATTAAIGICNLQLPTTMRAAPTPVVTTATSFGITVAAGTAGTCTTLAIIATSTTPQTVPLSCTTGSTLAAGNAAQFIGANTGVANTVTISADF